MQYGDDGFECTALEIGTQPLVEETDDPSSCHRRIDGEINRATRWRPSCARRRESPSRAPRPRMRSDHQGRPSLFAIPHNPCGLCLIVVQ